MDSTSASFPSLHSSSLIPQTLTTSVLPSPNTSLTQFPTTPHTFPAPSPQPPTPLPPLCRSTRTHKPPSYLVDYQCNPSHSSANSSSAKYSYPLSSVLNYSSISSPHLHYLMSLSSEHEPTTYQQAVQLQCWRDAMAEEIKALELNHTWSIVDIPPTSKPIGCKWVYRIKRHPDGSIERYKARLIAKGFSQTEGINYFETFSPVVKMATIRVVLALASAFRWHLQQLNVNNAFLHGELSEDVYMLLPPGVSSPGPRKCCKLLKSLYGLKQASRKWYEKLSSLLLSCGYQQAQADHSLFIKAENSTITALLIRG